MSQAAVIKKTQNELGKYVKKPPLSEKLLGKPPFRYLHDIINVVINDHGFLKGLFAETELQSDNIKDKEAKIAFLQKIIDATSLATNEQLDVKPTKIVAGHEAEKTNLLLQAIAKGIEQKIDSTAAVEQVLAGGGAQKPTKKPSDAKKPSKPKDPKTTSGSKTLRTPGQPTKPKVTGTSNKPLKDKARVPKPTASGSTSEAKDSKSRTKPTSREKRDGSKSKPKNATKEEKPKSSTSRTRSISRLSTKEGGKENSPPEAEAEGDNAETAVNGVPDIENEAVPQSLRSKSGRQRSELIIDDRDPIDGMVDEDGTLDAMATVDEPIDDVINDDNNLDEGLVLSDEIEAAESGANASELVDNSEILDDTDGPNSLMQLNGENGDVINLNETPNPIESDPTVDVDPAILKAMNREADGLNPNQLEDGSNPSDSGVGSLESPKHSNRVESLPATAQSKPESPPAQFPVPPTPGPGSSRPLSAYHPDLKENEVIPPNELEDPNNISQEIPERPKTGMGIRPRTGRKSARPPSARPAPPKVRERKEIPQDEIPRPPTGKPIANVILDNNQEDQGLDEDDDNFMVGNIEETLVVDDNEPRFEQIDPELERNKQELLEGDQDAKGILVAQILETKKELEDGRREAFSPETPGHRRVQIEQGFGASDAHKKKEKELIQKDVEKLTSSIQALTRSVNPLAKMLDYLQEDLDSMQKELESWRDENKVLCQNLKAEQSLTEQQLEPLKAQLEEMELAIYDQQDRISAVKSNILRNEEKISRLLAGINLNS